MKLFIGNATRQNYVFAYRLPERKVVTQDVPHGGQIQITGDLSTKDIDAILEQHQPYGLVAVSDIDRTKAFAGLCYQFDKPIPITQLMRAMKHNVDALVERGKEIRKEVAISESNLLENQLADGDRVEGLRKLEMSITEDNFDGREDRAPIADGYRVAREPGDAGPRPNRRPRQSRAA